MRHSMRQVAIMIETSRAHGRGLLQGIARYNRERGQWSTDFQDRLAETGITLADFRCSPMCSPTRAGLMTGRRPLRFGIMCSVIPPWTRHGLPASKDWIIAR